MSAKFIYSYIVLMVIAFALWSCQPVYAKSKTVKYGTASFYGNYHHGKKTASGERFNMNALTAAHKTLPLGCTIKVTNTDNNKSVVVKVNDRGPFHGNRVLDLSKGAAKQLDFIKSGTAKVKIEVLTLPDKPKKESKNVTISRDTAKGNDVLGELIARRKLTESPDAIYGLIASNKW